MKSNIYNLIEAFFLNRLNKQMHASRHTIASYSDTFQLLFKYAKEKLGKKPKDLSLNDFNAHFLTQFLDDLEKFRGISARTRNQRLAAIRSFFNYCAYQLPESNNLIAEVLSIPEKRTTQKLIDFLTQEEVCELLKAPDRKKWIGIRDYTFLIIALQTGLRLGELTTLQWKDVSLEHHSHIICFGKGRKQRMTPLSNESVKCLSRWYKILNPSQINVVFPTIHGSKMSPDAVQLMLSKHAKTAAKHCPSLHCKRVTPHMLRHTTAMRLIEKGIDIASIALLLGHESIKTTYIYLKADMALKEQILSKLPVFDAKMHRYKPDDDMKAILKRLSE